jgi:transposase
VVHCACSGRSSAFSVCGGNGRRESSEQHGFHLLVGAKAGRAGWRCKALLHFVGRSKISVISLRIPWAYGTILVDLQRHKVIEVLPDRSAETAAAWMATHPEIELVSRDRGGDYASATKNAAPQAVQCADRFHVLKNLGEALEGLLACHLAAHRRGQAETLSAIPLTVVPAKQPPRYRRSHPKAAELSQAKREERLAQYEQVVALRKQGCSQTAIAQQVGIGHATVSRWLAHDTVASTTTVPAQERA